METHIAKWGNSLAIRLPKQVVEALRLKEQEAITLKVEEASLIMVPKSCAARRKRFTLASMVSAMTPENCHEVFSDDAPVGQELI